MAVLSIAVDPSIKNELSKAIAAIQDAGFAVATKLDGKSLDVQMTLNETSLTQIGKTLENTGVILAVQGKAPVFILRKD